MFAVMLFQRPPLRLTDLLRKPDEAPLEQHLAAVADTARTQFTQVLLALAWLPYEAFYSLDAIVRTLWRMLVSHRRLLDGDHRASSNVSSMKATAAIWPRSIERCGSRRRSPC